MLEKRNELPEVCFSILPGMGNLIILKRGETGYYPSEWDTGNKAENAQIADLHNEAAGINPAQVGAMQVGSMCGFQVPGADPQVYFDKAKLVETVQAKGIIKDPVTSMFTPIEADLHRYEVAGKSAFYLDLASMPEAIMSRWSHSVMLPDLVQGKPLVPVSVDRHENGQCILTLESGCCVHKREISAGYQIIALVGVGPVEYALAELTTGKHPSFATWERTPGNDPDVEKNYYWGHYTERRKDAIEDFCDRASGKYEMLTEQRKPSIRAQLADAKQIREKEQVQKLIDKVEKAMEAYKDEWSAASNEYLIVDSSFICAVRDAYKYLTETHRFTPEEVECLLRSNNPLHAVASKWWEHQNDMSDFPLAIADAVKAQREAYGKETKQHAKEAR